MVGKPLPSFAISRGSNPTERSSLLGKVLRLDVDPPVMASLYRFEDPIAQGLQVYVLEQRGPMVSGSTASCMTRVGGSGWP